MGAVLDSSWTGQTFSPPTALDIGTIETAIVARLRAALPSLETAHFPDEPRSYRLTHRIGAALVTYRGAKYSTSSDTGNIIQERTLEFDVALLVRDLGWSAGGPAAGPSPGAYSLLEQVRVALTGYQ